MNTTVVRSNCIHDGTCLWSRPSRAAPHTQYRHLYHSALSLLFSQDSVRQSEICDLYQLELPRRLIIAKNEQIPRIDIPKRHAQLAMDIPTRGFAQFIISHIPRAPDAATSRLHALNVVLNYASSIPCENFSSISFNRTGGTDSSVARIVMRYIIVW